MWLCYSHHTFLLVIHHWNSTIWVWRSYVIKKALRDGYTWLRSILKQYLSGHIMRNLLPWIWVTRYNRFSTICWSNGCLSLRNWWLWRRMLSIRIKILLWSNWSWLLIFICCFIALWSIFNVIVWSISLKFQFTNISFDPNAKMSSYHQLLVIFISIL